MENYESVLIEISKISVWIVFIIKRHDGHDASILFLSLNMLPILYYVFKYRSAHFFCIEIKHWPGATYVKVTIP